MDSEEGYEHRSSHKVLTATVYHLFSFGVGTALALFTIYLIIPTDFSYCTNDTSQPSRPLRSCGSTPSEARAAGCIFDMLTAAWTPSECVDLEVTKEFLELEDWKYYKDKEGMEEVSPAELTTGDWDGYLWTTTRYHQIHCMYVWTRIHYATMGGPPVDTVIGSEIHTKHCQQMIMKNDSARISGRQEVFYRKC